MTPLVSIYHLNPDPSSLPPKPARGFLALDHCQGLKGQMDNVFRHRTLLECAF